MDYPSVTPFLFTLRRMVLCGAALLSSLLVHQAGSAAPVNTSAGNIGAVSIERLTPEAGAPQIEVYINPGMIFSPAAVSADGRFVAFASNATTLVQGDTNGVQDIFVADRRTGAIERVSTSGTGVEANGHSIFPDISGDGRYVVFTSQASNLSALNLTPGWNHFVKDRLTGQVQVANVNSKGEPANDVWESRYAPDSGGRISEDGRYVTFVSYASNLVPRDTTGWDAFVRDLVAGTTERVSITSEGAEIHGFMITSDISADGRYVVFDSDSPHLGEIEGRPYQVYLRDRWNGTTSLVSANAQGKPGDSHSMHPYVSNNGRIVAFFSDATDLGPNTSGMRGIYWRDMETGEIGRVDLEYDGTQPTAATSYVGDGNTATLSISGDGRFLAYVSTNSRLVRGDTNREYDIFVYDRETRRNQRVSVHANGRETLSISSGSDLSSDGSTVVFYSQADTLTEGDSNGRHDMYAVTLGPLGLPPAAPDLATVEAPNASQRILTWRDNSNDEAGFQVAYDLDPSLGVWEHALVAEPDRTTLTHNGVDPAKLHRYRVYAFNQAGYSDPAQAPAAPAAPGEVTFTQVEDDRFRVAWQDRSDNEQGFRVDYYVPGVPGFWQSLAETGPDTTSVVVEAANGTEKATYRVVAFNNGGDSDYDVFRIAPRDTPIVQPGKIHVSTRKLDFGTVRVARPRTRKLVIRNKGRGPLQVRLSLEEGAEVFGSDQLGEHVLAPGQKLQVQVTCLPASKGKVRGKLAIESSDPRKPLQQIRLKGKAR